jgi:hypothetical protein
VSQRSASLFEPILRQSIPVRQEFNRDPFFLPELTGTINRDRKILTAR